MSIAEAWIPEDTFALRLMAVRQRCGWTNVEKAAKACGITGQSWRDWEAGKSHPRDALAVCRKIAAKAGCSAAWLAFGGEAQKLKFLNAGITGVFLNPEPELPFPANDPGHLASVK